MNKRLFAFWSYLSTYPYLLGAEVLELYHDGSVKTTSYGGMRFKPLLILPLLAGQQTMAVIQAVAARHEVAQAEFKKKWQANLDQILPEQLCRQPKDRA